MVEFLTLLLGLVAGTIEIDLAVQGEVAQVRVELDGRYVETLSGRLADAVAIAGTQAAADTRPRAVVLLLAPGSENRDSRFEPQRVREYLRSLGVPFYVWYFGREPESPAGWGEATGIRGLKDLKEAMKELRAGLARQRIVWVEGLYLPDEVEVSLR